MLAQLVEFSLSELGHDSYNFHLMALNLGISKLFHFSDRETEKPESTQPMISWLPNLVIALVVPFLIC